MSTWVLAGLLVLAAAWAGALVMLYVQGRRELRWIRERLRESAQREQGERPDSAGEGYGGPPTANR